MNSHATYHLATAPLARPVRSATTPEPSVGPEALPLAVTILGALALVLIGAPAA